MYYILMGSSYPYTMWVSISIHHQLHALLAVSSTLPKRIQLVMRYTPCDTCCWPTSLLPPLGSHPSTSAGRSLRRCHLCYGYTVCIYPPAMRTPLWMWVVRWTVWQRRSRTSCPRPTVTRSTLLLQWRPWHRSSHHVKEGHITRWP